MLTRRGADSNIERRPDNIGKHAGEAAAARANAVSCAHAFACDPRILAHEFHYCDTTDNPYFVECKRHRRQGCRKHKQYLMNVSRGVQTVPALPTAECTPAACLAYTLPKSHITEGVVGASSV